MKQYPAASYCHNLGYQVVTNGGTNEMLKFVLSKQIKEWPKSTVPSVGHCLSLCLYWFSSSYSGKKINIRKKKKKKKII